MISQRSSISTEPACEFFTFTARAAKEAAELVAQSHEAPLYIRLRAEFHAGRQPEYFIVLVDSVSDSDTKVLTQGLTVFVDETNLRYFIGTQIDYEEDTPLPRFVIESPIASTSCGRSESFSSCPR
ncbi:MULTISPECIES: HesB/IscA family protein [Paraburkholderia]|uniref:Iron-sulfur cluster assembly accessory protein n=2 Tax=Paraburkholderia TaxID=1822464 RepID=A0ABU9SNN8_9BURK|nr:iron-sulfur cluster assembly accessory protein [Paraburkholderia nodosa]